MSEMPSEEETQFKKISKVAKKKEYVVVVSSKRVLKSTLQAQITRLNNDIQDIDNQIRALQQEKKEIAEKVEQYRILLGP